MKKRVIKAVMFMTLAVVVSLIIYAQKPDDSVEVEEMVYNDRVEQAASPDEVCEVCDDTGAAGITLREAFRERKTQITLMISGEDISESDYNDVFEQIYDIALEHTGVGDEGDYLKWHLSKVSVTYAKSSSTFEITADYLDDASMEEETSQAVKTAEESLPITSDDSSYDIIYTIYDYIANNVTYDEEDESDLPHTAYDAAVNGRAVCQGYAMLFYRILLDYGIDNRIIVSETHAWNLVYLDGEYYECDVTWDSQEVQAGNKYAYFLKADLSGGNKVHYWKSDALDNDVYALNRSGTDYGEDGSDSGMPSEYKRIAEIIRKSPCCAA